MSRLSYALVELKGIQKSPHGVSMYSRFVNRPAGRYFAALGYALHLSPNQVSLLGGLFSFAGIALIALASPSIALGLSVALLLEIGFVLDSADGQLARLIKRTAPNGEWLDHFLDCARSVALHSAVLISFYRFFDLSSKGWLLVPLIFQLASVLLFIGGTLASLLMRGSRHPQHPRTPSNVRAVALLPADFGILALAFAFLGAMDAFLAIYSALALTHVLILGALTLKWSRELSQLTPRSES